MTESANSEAAALPSLREFNLRYLLALDSIQPQLKHTASGSNGRHPLLRLVLLRAAREDIAIEGLQAAWQKHRRFCEPQANTLYHTAIPV